MRKVIFRDETFYFKIYRDPEFDTMGSWVKVYKRRRGIFSWVLPYKKIGHYKGWKKFCNEHTVAKLLEEAWVDKNPLVIQCSPDITSIYKS